MTLFSFVLQTFIERLPFPHIQNAAALTAKPQSPRARVSVSADVRGGRPCLRRPPGIQRRAPQPQRPACARPSGTAPRTCTRTGTPGSRVPGALSAPGAGGNSEVGAGGSSSRRGGCSRAVLVHMLLNSRRPAPIPPTPSPARGLRAPKAARVRARAQARALRGRPRRLHGKRRTVPD